MRRRHVNRLSSCANVAEVFRRWLHAMGVRPWPMQVRRRRRRIRLCIPQPRNSPAAGSAAAIPSHLLRDPFNFKPKHRLLLLLLLLLLLALLLLPPPPPLALPKSGKKIS